MIPSFKHVSEFDENPGDKTNLQKPSLPPLFEPKFQQDDVAVDYVNGSIELPNMSSSFEIYGQEPPEPDYVNDKIETASPFLPISGSEQPSPFPPSPGSEQPFPPTPNSDAPFPQQSIASVSLATGTNKIVPPELCPVYDNINFLPLK